ncbi:MAG: ABC transporter permease [Acidimicrobiia bacterium]|nr:ABC transporter permease [Acidimicrobiia bacterium]
MALPLTYNLRNLRVRWRVTLLAVGGIALVIAVLIVLVSMADGFRLALRATGSPANAIVTQRGSGSELTSGVGRDEANALMVDDRVARGPDNRPLASPEIVVVAVFERRDGAEVNAVVRGVTQTAFDVRTGIEIVEGRRFQPGLYEVVVGRSLNERMVGLEVGRTVRLQRRDWTIVGVFDAGGSGFDSELWGDVDVMAPAFNRGGGYQSITLRLTDPSSVAAFDAELERNPRMQLQVVQEQQYYEDQSGGVSGQLLGLAIFVAVVMGVGAVFGAMNTMYGIVAARTREIGTLRALGFSKAAILGAFLIESTVLALVGGVGGCLLALPADGLTSAAGGANFAEVAFAFRITPPSLVLGMGLAVLMGVVGGLLPALRAARLPITQALRD